MGIELDTVRALVEELVQVTGCELVDLEFKGAGKGRVLRIFVDKEGGISHQDCELISRQVGTVLDVEDPIPSAYTLEVSSPGLDRKLVTDRDFTRFRGRKVKIQTRLPVNNQKVFSGRLLSLKQGVVTLEVANDDLLEIPLGTVKETRLEVDWESELQNRKGP